MLVPNQAKAWQDMVLIENHITKPGDGRADDLKVRHYSTAVEGYSGWPSDTDYVYPAPRAGSWSPKITTLVEGHTLDMDARPTNSATSFYATLAAVIQDNQAIQGTNRLGIYVYDDSIYDFFDPKRHYVGEYNVNSNYIANTNSFSEKKNLRDLCPTSNVGYVWNGPTNLNINTTNNGTYDFGTFILSCDWNQLASSSTGNGTNNPAAGTAEILDYNTNKTVSLNAAQDNYINYYLLTRTGNTGDVSVTSNSCGPAIASTNVAIDGIKGSNSIHAVYSPKLTSSGIPHSWIREKGLTNFEDSVEEEDGDEDGFNNLQEYAADTDPRAGDDYFRAALVLADGADSVGFTATSTNCRYELLGRSNYLSGTWQSWTGFDGTGSAVYVDPGAAEFPSFVGGKVQRVNP